MEPAEPFKDTLIHTVPAKIFAQACGFPEASEEDDIEGQFLLRKQGSHIVLWEILDSSGSTRVLRSIGPITEAACGELVRRNGK